MARLMPMKKRSIHKGYKHFEKVFNAAIGLLLNWGFETASYAFYRCSAPLITRYTSNGPG